MMTRADKETTAERGRSIPKPGCKRRRINALDAFALLNLILFAVFASTVYWERFLQHKSRADSSEFFAYAVLFMAAITAAWGTLRSLRFSIWVLIISEAGILLHFAAGMVYPGGMRLYDVQIGIGFFGYPLRFDKIVHVIDALIGCIVTLEFLRLLSYRIPRILVPLVLLIVTGTGGLIEVIEYVVVKTIPRNGVGDYDNNMTDLLANLLGCLVFAALWAWKPIRRRLPCPPGQEL